MTVFASNKFPKEKRQSEGCEKKKISSCPCCFWFLWFCFLFPMHSVYSALASAYFKAVAFPRIKNLKQLHFLHFTHSNTSLALPSRLSFIWLFLGACCMLHVCPLSYLLLLFFGQHIYVCITSSASSAFAITSGHPALCNHFLFGLPLNACVK